MLSRRMFLQSSAAIAMISVTGLKAGAAPGKIVGHSVRCVGHVLTGKVPVEGIEIIYLSSTILRPTKEDQDIPEIRWKFLAAITIELGLDRRLNEEHIRRVDEMVASGFIRSRPPEMGLVGRKIWTRDGVPYWPPGLYGAMLPSVIASYERYA